MILTRIELDPTKRATIMALSNPNRFHGAIEKSRSVEGERILWRIDELRGKKYLMILSPSTVDSQLLANQFGYPGESPQQKNYDPLLERITQGSVWNFRLTANPTFSSPADRKDPQGRGKVKGEISTTVQLKWLERKAEANGFSLKPDQFGVVGSRWVTFKKQAERRKVSLTQVTYEGVLTVTDPELFKKALVDWIGRGKAYGMGLLTVVTPHA